MPKSAERVPPKHRSFHLDSRTVISLNQFRPYEGAKEKRFSYYEAYHMAYDLKEKVNNLAVREGTHTVCIEWNRPLKDPISRYSGVGLSCIKKIKEVRKSS